ncbi:MAG: fatty acid desaturase [Gammaproteobacteria bacterium]|nr:fatty acid desaturase [Gammaproteobacteria bacterium]MCW9031442.1 fatty acid desaturase [Gammaproteobacteria bacterium]
MTTPAQLKAIAPEIIKKYSHKSNAKGWFQNINTLVPYFALFYLAMESMQSQSYWLAVGFTLLLAFFIVRIFMLMHDCGHKSMFSTQIFNTLGGFFTGVLVGMPQYVWAQHHNYHHSTNGNWEKYRGPLNILSVNEFSQLSPGKQNKYRLSRSVLLAPLGAFMYFIFNPRFNWMLGSLQFAYAVTKNKLKNPGKTFKSIISNQESRFWKSSKEYLHMTLNNIVLLSIWLIASIYFGAATFFTIYIISLSLAGAAGLMIFTLQHNFEDAYAADTAHWDYYQGALKGTSFFTFPKVINWFGADIAFHHIHHLSASIPNYNLARAHREYAHLFDDVKRIRLRDIFKEFKFILWDEKNQKIISIAQYNDMKSNP